jgi:hypothetical protein
VRVLPGPDPGEPYTPGTVSPDFRRFISSVRVGPGRAHGGLLVFWLHAREPGPPLEVLTLDEARARGTLLITEKAQATVPELIVENRGKVHVLLMAGEILLGGKQNRVLREDILLPPWSGPRPIGVYCVEQGRWDAGRGGFESKATIAAPGLRDQVLSRAPQSRVWHEVDRAARAAEVPLSPSRSYQDLYERPDVKDHLTRVERALDHRPAAGAHGAAVFLGPRFTGLDLFHQPDLFARQWPKLLRAHALEAYRRPDGPEGKEALLRGRVEALLGEAARAEGLRRGNAGVGEVFDFRLDGARGTALLFEGRVVHTAIL